MKGSMDMLDLVFIATGAAFLAVCILYAFPEFAVHRHTAGIDKTFQKVRLVAQVYVS